MDFLKNLLNMFIQEEPTQKMRTPLICPECNRGLNEIEKYGAKIYFCNACNGYFMSQESLNSFLNSEQEEEAWPELFQQEATSENTFDRSLESRRCPGCDEKMDNVQFQYKSGIWVDYCPNGHGIWLDRGELSPIKEYKTHMDSPISSEEKSQMYSAMLDGSAQAYREINKINQEVAIQHPNSYGGHQLPVHPVIVMENIKESVEKRQERLVEEENKLLRKKTDDYNQIVSAFPEKLEEYKRRAKRDWDQDCLKWDTKFEMTEGYLQSKIKLYAKEEGLI